MRILIANPFGIGDVLFSLPLLRAIRAASPDAFIGYLCNERTQELVSSWPELNWHLAFEKDEFRRLWKKSKKEGYRFLSETLGTVRKQRFDLLVDLSLGWHTGLAGLICRIPRRIGFNFKGRGRFLTDSLRLRGFSSRSVAEHYLDLLRMLDFPRPGRVEWSIPLPETAQQQAAEQLSLHGLQNSNFAVVVPGGGASWGPNAGHKRWPPERFAQVADTLRTRHGLEILLAGDGREQALCAEVAGKMSAPPKGTLQVPSLLALAAILKRSRLVVGNDGGTLHLAAAAGAPTVSIFGPVDSSVYGPAPDSAPARVVARTLACRPCYRNFKMPDCPWDHICLKQLDVEPVLKAAGELLG